MGCCPIWRCGEAPPVNFTLVSTVYERGTFASQVVLVKLSSSTQRANFSKPSNSSGSEDQLAHTTTPPHHHTTTPPHHHTTTPQGQIGPNRGGRGPQGPPPGAQKKAQNRANIWQTRAP